MRTIFSSQRIEAARSLSAEFLAPAIDTLPESSDFETISLFLIAKASPLLEEIDDF